MELRFTLFLRISCELFGATVGVTYMFYVVWRCSFFFFYGCSLIVCTFLSVNFSGKFFRCLLLAGFGQCCEMMAFLLFDVIFLFLLFYEFFCECYVRSPVQCFSQCIPDH